MAEAASPAKMQSRTEGRLKKRSALACVAIMASEEIEGNTEDNFMKKQNNELVKDDEILREESMTDGPMLVSGLELRPITALSVSWMQRNNIFGDEMDLIWKSAAFAFLHSTPFPEIRKVVNNRSDFTDAVDCWIEKHIVHHNEISEISNVMNIAFKRYQSSVSESTKRGSATGN